MGVKSFALRAVAALLAAASTAVLAATPLLKPYTGAVPKAEKLAFKTPTLRVQFDIDSLMDLAPGALVDFTAPNGKVHPIVFDSVEDVGQGIRNWYGHYLDGKGTYDAVVTQGPDRVFGRISTPDGQYYLSPTADGYQFVLDYTLEQPVTHNPGKKRLSPPPEAIAASSANVRAKSASAIAPIAAATTTWSACSTAAPCTVDWLVLYTPTLLAGLGNSTSAVQTMIANAAATSNSAYSNSQIGIKLRVVATQLINYTEAAGQEPFTALDKITPINFSGKLPFDSANFGNVESLRTQSGADMVMIMMSDTSLQNGNNGGSDGLFGSGIAWVPNPNATGLQAGDRAIMYSAMVGCWNGCTSLISTHELGHNMGNAHDRATATLDAVGSSQTIATGSFPYSYGYYHCASGGLNCDVFSTASACLASFGGQNVVECAVGDKTANFSTIMAYFHKSTNRVNRFSNPATTCSGTNPALTNSSATCGVAGSVDEALTINNNAVQLANMTPTVIPESGTAASTTSVLTSGSPSVQGASVTFTASVGGASGTATGTVNFRDGGTSIPSCNAQSLSGGLATCTTAALAGGSHAITAAYSGDATYAASTSSPLTQVVNVTPTMGLVSSLNPALLGGNVTLTATISGGVTTGTVLFRSNGVTIGGCGAIPVSGGGSAGCTTSALPLGQNSIVATFSGAPGFNPATVSNFSQYVQATTSVVVGSSINPSVLGAPVTFTATVSSAGGAPLGTMSFYVDNVAVCTNVVMVGTTGTCTRSGLALGTRMVAAQFDGSTFFLPSAVGLAQNVITQKKKVVDFDQSGRAAILWQQTLGRTAMWLMNGPTQVGGRELFANGTGWAPKLVGDFNGDGYADILFENTDGGSAMWTMNGSTQIGGARLLNAQTPGSAWHAKFVADFDGDGKADILWEKDDGTIAIWLMNGTTQVGGGVLLAGGTNWHVKSVADFNGDGKADLLWENTDGSSALWLMNGTTQIGGGRLFAGGSGWFSTKAVDLNGDGMADILWTHNDGRVAVWIMNGSTQVGGAVILPAATGYAIAGAGDINGDGRADIVWAKADGTTAWWAMNGTTQIGGGTILPAGSGQTVKRVVDFTGDGRSDLLLTKLNGDTSMGVFNGTSFDVTSVLAGSFGYLPVIVPE